MRHPAGLVDSRHSCSSDRGPLRQGRRATQSPLSSVRPSGTREYFGSIQDTSTRDPCMGANQRDFPAGNSPLKGVLAHCADTCPRCAQEKYHPARPPTLLTAWWIAPSSMPRQYFPLCLAPTRQSRTIATTELIPERPATQVRDCRYGECGPWRSSKRRASLRTAEGAAVAAKCWRPAYPALNLLNDGIAALMWSQ
jgi:hypothetical protein